MSTFKKACIPRRIFADKKNFRTAIGAAVRFRMVASVFNVIVFSAAVRAHFKLRHRCIAPVIRDGFYDCKSRPAVCTVDKGILIPSVSGVKKFRKAVVAYAYVRRNKRVRSIRFSAFCNLKFRISFQFFEKFSLDFFN